MEKYQLKRSTLPGMSAAAVMIGICLFAGSVYMIGLIGSRIELARCGAMDFREATKQCFVYAFFPICGLSVLFYAERGFRIGFAKILIDSRGITRKIFGLSKNEIKWENIAQCGILTYRARRVAIPYMAFFSRYKLPDEALSGAINGEYFSKWPEIICVGLETEKEATALKEFCALHGKTLEDHRKEPRPKPF